MELSKEFLLFKNLDISNPTTSEVRKVTRFLASKSTDVVQLLIDLECFTPFNGKVARFWFTDEELLCRRACGPDDFCKGGKCDKYGCFDINS